MLKLYPFFPFLSLIFWVTISSACRGSPVKLQKSPLQETERQRVDATKEYERERKRMVASQLRARDIRSAAVLRAMEKVPRHRFMRPETQGYAYADHPVPIGLGQTISQPYIVALMTQTAQPKRGNRALEIGTGSGYQAAVLAELVREVYTIEIVPALADEARKVLSELGYDNVQVRKGDGYQGWPEQAPFDIILVTAAAEKIPEPLLEQLAEGGRLVMPVGKVSGVQALTLITKERGKLDKTYITSVLFVPMTGQIQK
jgi:protein-L-isoaspartate(D-aspartate) O-methyltransferase